jgi:hypothetical protein
MDAIMNKAFQNGKALWGFVNSLKAQSLTGLFVTADLLQAV